MTNTAFTLREAALLVAMSTATLRRAIKAGELRSVQRAPNGTHQVERVELQRWWASIGGRALNLDIIDADEETTR